VTSEEAGFDKPHAAPFQIALEKMCPKGGCIWMVGDNPVNDIQGAREQINAVTLQKIHKGSELVDGKNAPDAAFNNFSELRHLIARLGDRI
jgi:putative hydrolase of the HAD superfamily